jgi:predicted metal-binding membrane protein
MRPQLERIAIALAWRPEWPVVILVAVAWLAMAWLQLGAEPSHHVVSQSSFVVALNAWALMIVSMMVPVTLPAVRHVARNSICVRQHQAMAVYLAAFVAVWMIFGVLATAMLSTIQSFGIAGRSIVASTLALSTAWQVTAIKRRAIVACRKTVPLPPAGWRADAACARFGIQQAWRCLLACWPLMLLMAAAGHQLVLMIALTTMLLAEERTFRNDRLIAPFASVLAVATLVAALTA